MGIIVRWTSIVGVGFAVAACGGRMAGPEVRPDDLPSLEAERARKPNDQQLLVRLGAGYYRAKRSAEAVAVLRAALAIQPTFPAAVFLGLAFEQTGRLDSAQAAYRSAGALARGGAEKAELEARLANLTREQLVLFAKQAVAGEARLRATPAPNTVAVLPWRYLGANQELAPLERGIAHLLVTDLALVRSLVLVERERIQAIADELALTAAQRVEAPTAARSGRLVGASRVIQGTIREDARTSQIRLDANVVNTGSGAVAGRGTAADRLAALFTMEKQLVFSLLESLGVNLSPAERQAINERPTADLQAFLAFSRGLEAEDRGDYAAAAAQFRAAAARDPNFRAASTRAANAALLARPAGRSGAALAALASRQLPGAGPSSGRAVALRNAIDVVAPSSGGQIARRTLLGPALRSRLAEALRQDDPTQIGGIGEIIIVIPRP